MNDWQPPAPQHLPAQQQAASAATQTAPATHVPDYAALQKMALDAAAIGEKKSTGRAVRFFDVAAKGPEFGAVPVGHEWKRAFFFTGASQPGNYNFVEVVKRTYRIDGKFSSVIAGQGSLIDQVVSDMYTRQGEKPEWLTPRRRVFMQGLPIEFDAAGMMVFDPQELLDDSGQLRPQIYEMPATLFARLRTQVCAVGQFARQAGAAVPPEIAQADNDTINFALGYPLVFDATNGVPMIVSKRKTGTERRDIEYDLTRAERFPVPEHVWPALHNLHDLSEITRDASPELQQSILDKLGYSLSAQPQAAAPQPTYAQSPNPPQASPYGAQPAYTHTGTSQPAYTHTAPPPPQTSPYGAQSPYTPPAPPVPQAAGRALPPYNAQAAAPAYAPPLPPAQEPPPGAGDLEQMQQQLVAGPPPIDDSDIPF